MKPSELWPQMQGGPVPVRRAALHIATEASLLCLRGGEFGQGELLLRLPDSLDLHKLLAPWDGLTATRLTDAQQPNQQLVRLAPADEGYRDLYTLLADDLYSHLETTSGADAALRMILTRLRAWSGFLHRTAKLLDGRAVRGLFAELKAAEQFLVPVLGWPDALAAWTGPMGTSQDISTDRLALDVKATQAGDSLITISSVEQLDPPGSKVARLLQGHVTEGLGESLQDLVSRLLTAAGHAGAGAMLQARLIQAGASPSALDALEEQPMTLSGWVLHNVDDPAFPRLRRAALPQGLINASYRIDLAQSAALPQDPAELLQLLQPGTSTTP